MFGFFSKDTNAKNAAMYKITTYSDKAFLVSKYYSRSSSYLPMDMFTTSEKAQEYIDKEKARIS